MTHAAAYYFLNIKFYILLWILILSLIFLNQRSFYHQSFFSDISLSYLQINFHQGIINYFSLAKINSQ